MNNKDLFEFKSLNENYIKQKNAEILKLDEKRKQYENNIIEAKSEIEKDKNIKEKLGFDNVLLKDKYNSLKRILKERGIIIDIINNNYNIKEWDNLFIVKNSKNYIVATKKGEKLMIFDNEFSSILNEIMDETYSCSIVVFRVSDKIIKAQLRINLKNE